MIQVIAIHPSLSFNTRNDNNAMNRVLVVLYVIEAVPESGQDIVQERIQGNRPHQSPE